MELRLKYWTLLLAFMLTVPSHADMYYKQQPMGMMSRPAKVIHVHHYDAGSSGSMMSSNYKKHESSGGSSLIELLILSSLLSGTTNTGTQTALINGQLVPIQNG
ncbi:hypothetical protein Btru_065795 [Bulinus truncatus]|nr:hypothetical protein Btru_065795 [Bulinus truncatus]